jgi:hypothetical protein
MKKALIAILSLMWLGTLGYTAARITNSDISSSAAISYSKLATLTGDRALMTTQAGVVSVSPDITVAELGALNGVTSNLQTQIDAKQSSDADLTALAALSGTNTIYYRSGAATWSAVTIGSGLLFSGGEISQTFDYSDVWVVTANGYGSTHNKIRKFTTTRRNQGSSITYNNSAAADGATFTINTQGVYAITYTDQFSGSERLGISVDTAATTTDISSIPEDNRLCVNSTSAANDIELCSIVLPLNAGQIIRPHTNGVGSGVNTYGESFRITRVQ